MGRKRWWDPLFARGIPAHPLLPPPPVARAWNFPEEGYEGLITGNIYTDGALRGLHPEARRAGWAFAMIDEGSLRLKMAKYGVCSDRWMTVLRAELKAIDEAIRVAVAPVVIHTDSAVAVAAFRKGRDYCCNSRSDGADIWRRIWHMLESFGSFELCKVKAHTVPQDVVDGLILAAHQAGNAAADFFAVEARRQAEADQPTGDFVAHYTRARAWYKEVLRCVAEWKTDTLADAEEGTAVEQSIAEVPGLFRPSLVVQRHEIWELGQQWLCRACGKWFNPSCEPSVLARKVCRGAMHSRLLDSMGLVRECKTFFCHTAMEMRAKGAVQWMQEPNRPDGHAPAATAEGPHVRRRLVGKQPDPNSLVPRSVQSAMKERESGHLLVRSGRFTFCDRCGRWAIDRMSLGLLRRCAGSVDTAKGAYRIRRDRLRDGKHPLTGAPIA